MKDRHAIQSVRYFKRELQFKTPAKTSRDTLVSKPSWYVCLTDNHGHSGWGECSLILGLSPDNPQAVEAYFDGLVESPHRASEPVPAGLPAVRFAMEMAWNGLVNGHPLRFFPGSFESCEQAIAINGLIWMADPEALLEQARGLLGRGFTTLKMKVGSMPFDAELDWLKALREEAGPEVVLRTDANGAFSKPEKGWTPMRKLEALAELGFHSIEQPLAPTEQEALSDLCKRSPLPIALDESLIGVGSAKEKEALLNTIRPQYLVLKPSLLGGFRSSQEWIDAAEARGIGWWATSALESNLGLYAIAQWVQDGVRTAHPLMLQGLGTGGLFTNNIPGTMEVASGYLHNRPERQWSELHEIMDT